jgi:heat shock protein HtpX
MTVRRNAVAVVSGCLVAGVLAVGWALAGVAGLAAVCWLLVIAWWLAYFLAERRLLIPLGARPVTEVEKPELFRLVRELATEARVPVPRLFVCPWDQPNSLVVGCTARTAALCVTDGLLAVVSTAELRSIVAHELAHVRRHDMTISTLTGFFASLLLRVGLVPVAALLVRVFDRPSREFSADLDGALLTGSPLDMATALRMVEVGVRTEPGAFTRSLASVAHLLLVAPFDPSGLARLFSSHPSTGERLRRLESLAGYRR